MFGKALDKGFTLCNTYRKFQHADKSKSESKKKGEIFTNIRKTKVKDITY